MKYKCMYFFFASLLIFACNNNANIENLGDSSSSSKYNASSSSGRYSSSEPAHDVSSSSELVPDISSSSATLGLSSMASSSSSAITSTSAWPKLQENQSGVQKGWGSRYWDGCKPHCSQRTNVDTNAVPFTVCRNCNKNNNEIPAFTLSPNIEVRYQQWDGRIVEDWLGYEETINSCQNGGIAYACWDMAPIALSDTLAYAFMATSLKNASCGQCFQIQFDGGNHGNDVKEAHKLIKGKTLIVMATNTGSDVEAGQFDIMIPGGGPGMYNSFAEQIGVNKDQLGEGYGGFLTTCQREFNDYNKPAKDYQDCVKKKCNAVFSKSEHKALLDGCLWFADWYMAADNPTYLYKKADCPKYFTDKYPSAINTEPNNRIEPYGGFKKNIPSGYETQKWIW